MALSAQEHSKNDRIRPAPESPRGSFAATVHENRHLCTDRLPADSLGCRGFRASHPGQFVQLDCLAIRR